MYKLIRFQAHNVIGFVSGLSKKKVDIDLRNYTDKSILCILGDNATGKSTFLSLIHPAHAPSDDRSKFIVPGKEGLLIRTYREDDGTILISKCVYHPKKDSDSHNTSCYLAIKKPGDPKDDPPLELNPNGNVTSYYSLLQTYFGISKDFISFATYNDAVNNIVEMTGQERKNSVSAMIPNTKRYDVAYAVVNDKYRDLKNQIRNVSQKILAIRDEDSLIADKLRIEKQLQKAEFARDENLQAFAKYQGQVNELSHGEDIRSLISSYDRMVMNLKSQEAGLNQANQMIQMSCDMLGLDLTSETDLATRIPKNISKYERKIATVEATIRSSGSRLDEYQKRYFQYQKELSENESAMFSVESQDIDELEKTKKNYLQTIKDMRYTQVKDQYSNMSYDEVVTFSRTVSMLDHMIQALYDEYGDLVTQVIQEGIDSPIQDGAKLSATIETTSAKRDLIYRQMIEKEQYRKFQDILDQRPSTCHIDSCPFIQNALKWQRISSELEELKRQYEDLGLELSNAQRDYTDLTKKNQLRVDIQTVYNLVKTNEELFVKYLNCGFDAIIKAISNGTWQSALDMIRLKNIAAILSEKDLYLRITTVLLPDVEHSIELAKVYITNRDLIQSRMERIRQEMDLITKESDRVQMENVVSTKMLTVYQNKLAVWRNLQEAYNQRRELYLNWDQLHEEAETKKDEIEKIMKLVRKAEEAEHAMNGAKDTISELTPIKQQIDIELNALRNLKIEKDQIELNFLTVEVIRSIIQPGKGLRKELINIYMYDIYQTANQLLLNTFNGRLYLKEFIITDKEFTIPYVYNGAEGSDIAYASSSQRSVIAMAISLAILGKMMDKYGIVAIDEADRALSTENKAVFVDILARQMKYLGITQAFVITHSFEFYEGFDVGVIAFPGAKFHKKDTDYLEV